jgi:hypothetical protein
MAKNIGNRFKPAAEIAADDFSISFGPKGANQAERPVEVNYSVLDPDKGRLQMMWQGLASDLIGVGPLTSAKALQLRDLLRDVAAAALEDNDHHEE